MPRINYKIYALTGAEAAAEAMRQINPDVVAAYPITPQTPIIEKFAQFVANGQVDSEFIPAESEHSALSCVVGAQASGARAMTATSAVGLALMHEVMGVVSGLRLPCVMLVANRSLSAPINIHCDHSDSMAERDQGWIQIYCENNQEVYENTLLALRLSEDKQVLLPSQVMQDGFVTSHNVEKVKIYKDSLVKKFIGEFKPRYSLFDFKNPKTFGATALPDYLMETKKQLSEAMKKAKDVYLKIGKELFQITGNRYPLFDEYRLKDAEICLIALASTAGTIKMVIDELRSEGKKVGLLKPRLFRPFPYEEVARTLAKKKVIGVFDRSESFGAYPPLFTEIRSALFNSPKRPEMQSYVFGLGGRDIRPEEIREAAEELLQGKIEKEIKYLGLREL